LVRFSRDLATQRAQRARPLQGMDIQRFTIPDSDEVVYIPNFVTEEEESYLLRKVGSLSLTLLIDLV
jgi:hypothetical protein